MTPLTLLSNALPLVAILGFSNLVSLCFRIHPGIGLFYTIFTLLLAQTLCAIAGIITYASPMILCTGTALFILSYYWLYRKNVTTTQPILTTNALYLVLYLLTIPFYWHLRPSIIDDYVYWATVSKFLFLFGHLPTHHTTYLIHHEHLSYTPGLAAFHHLFYTAAGHYSVFSGFAAQNTLIWSCFIPFFNPKKILPSLSLMAVPIITFSLGFAYFFAHMQGGAVLAALLTGTFFVILSLPPNKKKWMLLTAPLLSLYFIRQTGWIFSLFCMALWFLCDIKQETSRKHFFIFLSLLASLVFVLKFVWIHHYTVAGFHPFLTHFPLSNMLSSLNPFDSNFHPQQQLMLKALFLYRFDGIFNLPYGLLYLLIGFLWYKINTQQNATLTQQNNSPTFMWCTTGFLFLYALILYFVETVVFHIGIHQPHLYAFSRFYNYLFTPILTISIILYLASKKSRAIPTTFITFAALLLIGGRIEKAYHTNAYATSGQFSDTLKRTLPPHPPQLICITNLSKPIDPLLVELQFYLMPDRLKHLKKITEKNAHTCDYLVDYQKRRYKIPHAPAPP